MENKPLKIEKKVFDELCEFFYRRGEELYTREGLDKMTPQEKTAAVLYILQLELDKDKDE